MSFAHLINWSVGQLLDRVVCWLIGWMLNQSYGELSDCLSIFCHLMILLDVYKVIYVGSVELVDCGFDRLMIIIMSANLKF